MVEIDYKGWGKKKVKCNVAPNRRGGVVGWYIARLSWGGVFLFRAPLVTHCACLNIA